MLRLRPMAYKRHPYMWPTIGREISHIEKVDLDRIKSFFYSHYGPNNAILTLSGSISNEVGYTMASRWFADIPPCRIAERMLPSEPEQTAPRFMTIEKDVPSSVIYKAWHVCGRDDKEFIILDLLTDILAGGESGRLYEKLVREKKLFSDINAYLTGDIDPGLMIISGRVMDGVDIMDADNEIKALISDLCNSEIPADEMEKTMNKFEANAVFSNTSILYKAMTLSYFELLGDAARMNSEVQRYRSIKPEMVSEAALKYLGENRCSTLYYQPEK
jgi:predicted Zn-dependent peptidase